MSKTIIFLIAMSISAGYSLAETGIEFGIKRSVVSDYSQNQLKLPSETRLNSIGGRFYLSSPPVIDLIIEIDNRSDLMTLNPGGYQVELKMRDYSVALSVVVPIRISVVEAYFGGGIGSHSIAYQYRHPASLTLSDYGIEIPESSTYPGYHAIAGLRYNPTGWAVGLFIEAEASTINSPGDNISYFEIGGGISFALPE